MFGSKINPSGAAADLGDEIANSVRFNDNDSAYLSRTPASASNRKTWTWSAWIKRGNITLGNRSTLFSGRTTGTSNLFGFFNPSTNGAADTFGAYLGANGDDRFQTTRVFRDPNAWYHFVVVLDTTDATSDDRFKLYVNGTRETVWTRFDFITQNQDKGFNEAISHSIGAEGTTLFFDGCMAEVNFIDGTALDPTNFGRYSTTHPNVWVPIEYTGSYGTNGFHLDFAVAPGTGNGAGTDTSGNTNDWTESGLTADDQLSDTPSNVFCALSPVNAGSAMVLSEASLRVSVGTSQSVGGTFLLDGMLSYWEVEAKVTPNNGVLGIGRDFLHTANFVNTGIHGIYATANQWYSDGSNLTTPTHASISSGDRLMFAFDEPNGKLYVGLNGTWLNSGDPAAGTGAVFTGLTQGGYVPYFGTGTSPTNDYHFSFGQDTTNIASAVSDGNGYGNFEYTPPTGFLALCQANLPNVVTDLGGVDKPWKHFVAVTRLGDATADASTVDDFDPVLAWIKNRDQLDEHKLVDQVRGATKELNTDSTNAESTDANGVTAFGTNSYTLGTGAGGYNDSGENFLDLLFDGNGAGVVNNDGSIQSTVSVSPSGAWSFIKYTASATPAAGDTIGHSLPGEPDMLVFFRRSATSNHMVYVRSLGAGNSDYLMLDLTISKGSPGAVNYLNATHPGASVITLGNDTNVNAANATYFVMAFRSVPGLCKVGSYTGNGNFDGSFVPLNFNPKVFLLKRTDVANDWLLGYLPNGSNAGEYVFANSTAVSGPLSLDMTSTGVKIRTSGATYNASGGNYVFLAIAESAIGGGIAFPNAR